MFIKNISNELKCNNTDLQYFLGHIVHQSSNNHRYNEQHLFLLDKLNMIYLYELHSSPPHLQEKYFSTKNPLGPSI